MTRPWQIMALVAVVAASFVAVMVVLSPGEPEPAGPDPSQVQPAGSAVEPDQLIAAWERSMTADYALDGEIRVYVDGELVKTSRLRQARLGDRRLDQIDGTSLVVAGDQIRSCEPINDLEVGCGAPRPISTVEDEIAVIRGRVDGDNAPYLVYPDDACWLVAARQPEPISPWGQASTFCFDELTGALASWDKVTANRREEQIATSIRSDVSEFDLTPLTG